MRGCGVPGPGAEVEMLELPEPRQPEQGELLVEVEAAGAGAWDRLLFGGGWDVGLRPPAALGVEGVGRVLASGSGVEGIRVGDRVLAHAAPLPGGSGFWAERVLIRAAHAAPCPPALDPVQAAALPVNGLTAAQAVEWLGLGSGQRLLVTNGAGATGALAVQLAAATGVRVTATASPGNGLRLRRLGVAEVLDYQDPRWPQRAGTDFDGVLAAAPGTAPTAFSLVRAGGRLCSLTSDAPAPTTAVDTKNLYVQPDPRRLAELAADVGTGRLRMAVQARKLEEGPAVFAQVTHGRAGGWKFVLTP